MSKYDIVSNKIKDNDTWNICPECQKSWKNTETIPGLLLQAKLCKRCLERFKRSK